MSDYVCPKCGNFINWTLDPDVVFVLTIRCGMWPRCSFSADVPYDNNVLESWYLEAVENYKQEQENE